MKRRSTAQMGDARPYVDVAPDAVRAGGWRLVGVEGEEALPDWVATWDMSQTLRVRRQIEVDLDRVFTQARLPTGSRLALSVIYTSEFEDEACRGCLDRAG